MRVGRAQPLAGYTFYTSYTSYTFYTSYTSYTFSTQGCTSPLVAPDHGLRVAHGHQGEEQAAPLARTVAPVAEVVGAGGVPG